MKIRMFIQLSLITGVVILTITSGLQLVRAKSLQTNLLTPIQDKPTLYLQRVRSEIDFARSPFQITQSDTYTITDLGTLYGVPLRPYFVNDLGQVVGSFQSQFYNYCFFWENGLVYDLGTLGYDHCSVADINNSGQVAGTLSQEGGGSRAFLWENGEMYDLGTLGGTYSYASDINNAGQMVGSSSIDLGSYIYHPFLWENDVMHDLGTLNGGSGYSRNSFTHPS